MGRGHTPTNVATVISGTFRLTLHKPYSEDLLKLYFVEYTTSVRLCFAMEFVTYGWQ